MFSRINEKRIHQLLFITVRCRYYKETSHNNEKLYLFIFFKIQFIINIS